MLQKDPQLNIFGRNYRVHICLAVNDEKLAFLSLDLTSLYHYYTCIISGKKRTFFGHKAAKKNSAIRLRKKKILAVKKVLDFFLVLLNITSVLPSSQSCNIWREMSSRYQIFYAVWQKGIYETKGCTGTLCDFKARKLLFK